jgi:hypothetical protein
MKRVIITILTLAVLSFFPAQDIYAGASFDVKKSESIEKNLAFEGGSEMRFFKVDNVFGAIKAEGYNGKSIKLKAIKSIRAKSKEYLQIAEKEIKLDISIKGNRIEVIVDGPFRADDGHICRHSNKRGYIVKYDFKLMIPHNTSVDLSTVNEGEITLKNIQGDCMVHNVNDKVTVSDITGNFDIKTVNGPVRIDRVTGSGSAHTVNGGVYVGFVKNPRKDCSFHTINGKLDIDFRTGLAAKFKLKTFNGKIYSDFPASYLPHTAGKGERKKGKYVYKTNGFQGVRIGNGGPTIKMDTLNGNIYINKGE